jgi:GH25 family lysozyme M1 (1,4-beta-N-acetylmuramidase)
MSEFPLGIDISAYQYSQYGKRKPNFDIINAKCEFVAVRAGISWGYIDKWFTYSWEHLTVPRMAYLVVYPGENAIDQMHHFLDIVNPIDTDRLVLDMELDHGQGKAKITDTIIGCLEYVREQTGRYPIVYSRAGWIDQFVDVSKLPDVDWWLANYLKALPYPQYTPEKTPPPALPRGVTKWLIHQTSQYANGSEFGVASHYVDLDRWNGNSDDILAYFGLTGHPEPEPEPTLEQKVDKLWTAHPELHGEL